MPQPKQQIYEGVRVLDLGNRYDGTTIAGAYMADFGADVIKIDKPDDDAPARGDSYVKNNVYLPYKVQGRNKRHITLDIGKPRGRDIFQRLVAVSDVVIETNPPGVMEAWGHDWETLRSINPRLIFCRISPFGQTGPYAHCRLDGRTAEAFGGFCQFDGERDGPPSTLRWTWGVKWQVCGPSWESIPRYTGVTPVEMARDRPSMLVCTSPSTAKSCTMLLHTAQ